MWDGQKRCIFIKKNFLDKLQNKVDELPEPLYIAHPILVFVAVVVAVVL